jgi:translation initiation factor 2 beta subunit (eIF-2beta)/eIF-5
MRRVNIPRSQIDPFYRYKREVVQTIPGKANSTILTNVDTIAHQLNRSPAEIMAFLRKKLGTSVITTKQGPGLRGPFTSEQVEGLLDEYIETNVLCSACGNPETQIETKGRVCRACGATS